MDVTDEYILFKEKEKYKKVYVYEVVPVTFLNFSIEVQSNILNLYSEFLREFNLNFQIYISSKRIDNQNYLELIQKSFKSQNTQSIEGRESSENIENEKVSRYNDLLSKYLYSIEKKLEDTSVYTTRYYLVLSVDRENEIDIKSVDTLVKRLDNIGCITKRMNSKRKLKSLIYESMNREIVS